MTARMWRHRLSKLRSLPRHELRELAVAQHALVLAQILVWTRPRGALIDGVNASGSPADEWSRDGITVARRLSLAVQRAGEHGLFRPTCLVRSIALQRMLLRHGLKGARIQIGVLPGEDRLLAHAWVQHGELILGDQPHNVRVFEPFGAVDFRH